MTSKLKTDVLETVSGSGTIALTNQLSGMTSASMPSGSVIQVVNATNTYDAQGGYLVQTSSSTFVAAALAVSITPSSTSSKIMVFFNTSVYRASHSGYLTVYRDSTNIAGADGLAAPTGGNPTWIPVGVQYLDSPNTTSSVQYTLFARSQSGIFYVGGDNDLINSITLMEIKG
mgnify:FL=1|tara:strand:+ start:545 stop:1063 length:519 start_codon:yes stop_codon:yes gene_type:complete